MYLLHAEEFGPPVTPDSVVGKDILLDGSFSGPEPSNTQVQHDLTPSTQLIGILETESAEQYQVKPNYLHSSVLIQSPRDSSDQGVSERCRRRTCEWMYDITDYFALKREVVGIALFYVDRYFTVTFEGSGSGQVPVTRRQFQLVALTGLYIAVKLHGECRQENLVRRQSLGSPNQPNNSQTNNSQPWNRLKFSLAICASISRNQFSPREIEECERSMLKTLDWHVNPIVSSGTIIDSLLMYLPSSMSARTIDEGMDESLALFVFDSAKYLAELSISVPALTLVYKPSVVAYASILHALDALSNSKSGSCLAVLSRQDYEKLILQVSSHHFDHEKEHVEGAKKILKAICPDLTKLFPLPSMTPESPTSVKVSRV